eukprot:CAMPEP_0172725882 /NCGR_PEP_ID=MMETSP1074-20121228/89477_1 /TAXON_ID=2916 /ORGANISM="Ceratium fusus, Strain PA161109" /LENGTH=44 /DNA_ID= /DNA_START= /DNA_END= /DNA_ORIENTATION=
MKAIMCIIPCRPLLKYGNAAAPTTAPSLPAAAEIPCAVARILVG